MISQNYEQKYKQSVVEFFNGRTTYDNEHTIRRALPLLAMVSLQAGHRVLDMATGTGIIAIASAQAVGTNGHVVGVDFSSGMLKQAEEKIVDLGLQNIELIEADADYLQFENESFDVVFCSSAIVYLRDIAAVLKNWYRWLKPGGTVAFSGWSEQSYPAPWIIEACAQQNISIQNINEPTGTAEKCRMLLGAAGFQSVDVQSQQMGKYRTIEQLGGWDGSWFHPEENPLLRLTREQRQSLLTNYRRILTQKITQQGIWCESLAFFVAGHKLQQGQEKRFMLPPVT